jgi:hypothetical protein
VCAQTASAIRRYKTEAEEAAINKLTRGSPTAGEIERTIKKAIGMDGEAKTDVVLMLDAACALEQIDMTGGLGLYQGATTKLLKMPQMTRRVDEEERRKHMDELGDIYIKGLHQDLQRRLEHFLLGDDEGGIVTKTGSLSEEVKDDARQLIAKTKSMTSGRRGAGAKKTSRPRADASGGERMFLRNILDSYLIIRLIPGIFEGVPDFDPPLAITVRSKAE